VTPSNRDSLKIELDAATLYKLGYVVADIQSVLRHESATTTAKCIKSLGLEGVRSALEALSQQKRQNFDFQTAGGNGGRKSFRKRKSHLRSRQLLKWLFSD
jgi:hypothetical protein